jgi:hypothetical protein
MKVYAAISAVMADLAKEGVSKSRRNAQQGYNFRGIDDMYNALSGPLAAHGLVVIPQVQERACEERAAKSGGVLFYVTVRVQFDIVCAEDGSKHTAVTYGEAMDSADKATNKAMSAAYKYLAMQLFCIPTEGDNDADATTPEVARKPSGRDLLPDAPAPLADSTAAALLNDIENASDMDSLKRAYQAAYSAAKSANSQPYLSRFLAAKEQRKAFLTPKELAS